MVMRFYPFLNIMKSIQENIKKICVVGSGIISYSFILKLLNNKKERNLIYWITDNRDEIINFNSSKQINRRLGFSGSSTVWHSVSPTSTNKKYLDFLKEFYNVDNSSFLDYANSNSRLFIPKKNPQTKNRIRKIIKNHHKIIEVKSRVKYINNESNKKWKVITESKQNYLFDLVFIGVNIQDVSSLFKKKIIDFNIFDHIQAHLGVISYDSIINKKLIRPIRTNYGYFIEIEENDSCILMLRPIHRINHQLSKEKIQNFGKSKYQIIIETIFSFSFGRIIEAISTKFGFFFKAKYYSVYIQKREDFSKLDLNTDYSKDDIIKIIRKFKSIPNTLQHYTGFKIYGNHQIGETNFSNINFLSKNNLIIGNLKLNNWLKGKHHTLINAYENYT